MRILGVLPCDAESVRGVEGSGAGRTGTAFRMRSCKDPSSIARLMRFTTLVRSSSSTAP